MAKEKKAKEAKKVVSMVSSRNRAPADNALLETCPSTCTVLFPVWDDSKCMRQSAVIKIRIVGGYYLVSIQCPTERVEATLTVETLVGLEGQIEAAINADKLVWLPDWESQKKTRQVVVDAIES